jgi:hypothetical protein
MMSRANARRRRRRRLRLLRTVLVVLAIIVIAVVATSGSGKHRGPAKSETTAGTTPAAAAATVPTTAALPAALVVAHLPATLPQAVSRASVVVRGGRLIVLGGLHGSSPGTSTSQVLTVDPTSGAAQAGPPLAVATHDAAAVQLGTTVLVFGGGSGTTIATVQQWTATGARVISHLPQARSDIAATVVDGHAYVIGGFDGAKPTADVLETDDGVTFHVAATLPVAVRYAAIAAVGSKIYVIGGQSVTGAAGNGPDVGDVQLVDVSNGSATVVSQLPGALTEASAFVLRGAIFVAGGVRGGLVQRGVFRLDPTSGALTPVATLPEPRADAAVASVGGTAYLIGGESPARLASIVALQGS